MRMAKKLVAVVLAVILVVCAFAGCSNGGGSKSTEKKGMSADVIARADIKSDVTVPKDFKIGLICLHDENSTYDKNFIDAMKSTASRHGP